MIMRKRHSQSGFTFVEMLISMAILLIVMTTAFEFLNSIQRRKQVEEERVDILEESRDFVDELSRDLRNAGYPNGRMYGCGTSVAGGGIVNGPTCSITATTNPPQNSPSLAVGLVAVSATDVVFEGDVNQDGQIDSMRYQLQPIGGPCPCSLMRSQVPKVAGSPNPVANGGAQGSNFTVQVDNVINSIGGAAPYAITGTTPGGIANDVYYATFKTAPIFTFFDGSSPPKVLNVPNDLSAANFAAGQAIANQVRSVMITVNILAPVPDPKSHIRPGVTMRTMVRIPNN